MNKNMWIILIIFLSVCVGLVVYNNKQIEMQSSPAEITEIEQIEPKDEEPQANISNPASDYCIKNGGKLEIITESDGSQFGLCMLKDYSCEEWTYYRGECDIQGDAELIKQELLKKGLDLSMTKVVINKHLGKYIGASVVPIDINAGGGGGYVFAVKDAGIVKVLADGNGTISCESFKDYPDYPAYLVSACIDPDTGNVVDR